MRTRAIGTVLAIAMGAGSGIAMAQYYGRPGPPPAYGQSYTQSYGQRGWDEAPAEFREAQRRGFRDGVEGAKKDFDNHRQPNVMNRDEYRNPHFISPPDRADYRMGFQRGYDVAVRHIYGQR